MATQKSFGAKMYFRLTFYVVIYIIMKWVYKVCSRPEKKKKKIFFRITSSISSYALTLSGYPGCHSNK